MTAFIPQISTRPLLKDLGINQMLKLVNYRMEEMDKSLDQLTSIAKRALSPTIRKDCLIFIKRQCKLIEVAEDIEQRLKSILSMRPVRLKAAYQDGTLKQLIQETTLLYEMHFQVKQSYFTFVNRYYQPQAASSKSLVA